MLKNSTCSAFESSSDPSHKGFPPECSADLHLVSWLVEVINFAHMSNTSVMKPSKNQTGGRVKMTKAKDVLGEFVMTSEHPSTFYRVRGQCSVRQRLCLDHLISAVPVDFLQITRNLQQHSLHKNITT